LAQEEALVAPKAVDSPRELPRLEELVLSRVAQVDSRATVVPQELHRLEELVLALVDPKAASDHQEAPQQVIRPLLEGKAVALVVSKAAVDHPVAHHLEELVSSRVVLADSKVAVDRPHQAVCRHSEAKAIIALAVSKVVEELPEALLWEIYLHLVLRAAVREVLQAAEDLLELLLREIRLHLALRAAVREVSQAAEDPLEALLREIRLRLDPWAVVSVGLQVPRPSVLREAVPEDFRTVDPLQEPEIPRRLAP